MKTRQTAAFTVLELLLVVTLVFTLLGVILPGITNRGMCTTRISCLSNVKQIGLAFLMWANEHGGKFPMEVTRAEGGTKELALQGLPLTSFNVISNQACSPKLFHCPGDNERKRVAEFAQLTPNNISYFLGLDASENNPKAILSGDRNLNIDGRPATGLAQITTGSAVTWSTSIHNRQGNLVLADGSAYQSTDRILQRMLQASGVATNRFAIP